MASNPNAVLKTWIVEAHVEGERMSTLTLPAPSASGCNRSDMPKSKRTRRKVRSRMPLKRRVGRGAKKRK